MALHHAEDSTFVACQREIEKVADDCFTLPNSTQFFQYPELGKQIGDIDDTQNRQKQGCKLGTPA